MGFFDSIADSFRGLGKTLGSGFSNIGKGLVSGTQWIGKRAGDVGGFVQGALNKVRNIPVLGALVDTPIPQLKGMSIGGAIDKGTQALDNFNTAVQNNGLSINDRIRAVRNLRDLSKKNKNNLI
jgi:hypothetical protein